MTAPDASVRSRRMLVTLMAVWIVAISLFSVYCGLPPDPVPENAPATEFSAIRAHEHLEAFASEPHPAGTEANDRVRDYIAATIRAMGGEPVFQTDMVFRGHNVSTPRNVLVRLPGTQPTRAFLLDAHYDSVMWGPGASDDGAGVAAMLETYRTLKAGPPLKNDIIFLFSDGEERGLLGAKSFVDNSPWMKDVGLVLGFEARGTSGPAYLFEMSKNNGWLVRELARSAPYPAASSMMFDIYDRMPNSSNFAIFKQQVPGFNVAHIGNLPFYHTPMDNPQNISLSSLQHHGTYALAFARHFGNMDLTHIPQEPDAVYFNLFGKWLIHYPGSWGVPLTVLTLVALSALILLGIVRASLSVRGLMFAFAGVLVAILASASAAIAILLIGWVVRGVYMLYHDPLYILSALSFTWLIVTTLYRSYRNRINVNDMMAGGLLWWGVALIASQIWLPGATFLFTWPLLSATLGLGMLMFLRNHGLLTVPRVVVLAVCTLPAMVLMVPTIYGLTLAVAIVFGAVEMALVVFLMVLFAHYLYANAEFPTRPKLILAGPVFLIAALALGGPSSQYPRFSHVAYGLNADTNEAFWIGMGKKPDEWNVQFFPPDTPRESIEEFGFPEPYLKASAPVARIQPANVNVVSDTVDGGMRNLVLRVESPENAPRMVIAGSSQGKPVEVLVNGRSFAQDTKAWRVDYRILPQDGIDLTIKADPADAIGILTIEYYYHLPEIPQAPINPRPDHIIAQPNTVSFDKGLQSDQTLVRKKFDFGPSAGSSSGGA